MDTRKTEAFLSCMRASVRDEGLETLPENTLPYTLAMLLEFVNRKQHVSRRQEVSELESVPSLTALLVILYNTIQLNTGKIQLFLAENQEAMEELLRSIIGLPFSAYKRMDRAWQAQISKSASKDFLECTNHRFAFLVMRVCSEICRQLVTNYGLTQSWIAGLPDLLPLLWKNTVEAGFVEEVFPSYSAVLIETVQLNYFQDASPTGELRDIPCSSLLMRLFQTIAPLPPNIHTLLRSEKLIYARNHIFCGLLESCCAPYLIRVLDGQSRLTTEAIASTIVSLTNKTFEYICALKKEISDMGSETAGRYVTLVFCAVRLSAAVVSLNSVWKYHSIGMPTELRDSIEAIICESVTLSNCCVNLTDSARQSLEDAMLALKIASVKSLPATEVLEIFPIIRSGRADRSSNPRRETTKICPENSDILDVLAGFLTNDDPRTFTKTLLPIARWSYETYMASQNSSTEAQSAYAVDVSHLFYKIWTMAGAFVRGSGPSAIAEAQSNECIDFFKEISHPAMLKSTWICPYVCEAILNTISRCELTEKTKPGDPLFSTLQLVAKNVIPRLCNAFVSFHTEIDETPLHHSKARLEDRNCAQVLKQRKQLLQQVRHAKNSKTQRALASIITRRARHELHSSPLSALLLQFHRPRVQSGLRQSKEESLQHAQGMLLYTVVSYARIVTRDDATRITSELVLTLRKTIDSIFSENFSQQIYQTSGNLTALTQLCIALVAHIESTSAIELLESLMLKVNQLLLAVQNPDKISSDSRQLDLIAVHCSYLALFLIGRYGLSDLECVKYVNFIHTCGYFVCGELMKLSIENHQGPSADIFSLSADNSMSLWTDERVLRMLLRELVKYPLEAILTMLQASDTLREMCHREGRMQERHQESALGVSKFPVNNTFGFEDGRKFWELYPLALSPGAVKLDALRLACFELPDTELQQEVQYIVQLDANELSHTASPSNAPEIARTPTSSEASGELKLSTGNDRSKRRRDVDSSSDDEDDEINQLGDNSRKRSRREQSSKFRKLSSGSSRKGESQNGVKGTQNENATTSVFRRLYNANRHKQALAKSRRSRIGGNTHTGFRPSRSVYASRRAQGDMKKPNLPEPYAYFPL